MKIFLLIIFCFSNFFLIAQNGVPTKHKLNKAFIKSIKVKGGTSEYSNWDSWIACNDSGLFFKSDTIFLKNHVVHAFPKPCCEQVALKFYKKHKLILVKSNYCQTSSFSRIIESIDSVGYKVMNRKNQLIFELIKNGVVIHSFRVHRLYQSFHDYKTSPTNMLILIRQKI